MAFLNFHAVSVLTLILPLLIHAAEPPTLSADAAFQRFTEKTLIDHLAWRPAFGMSLGLHEYDGRLTDFRPASVAAELARLKQCDAALTSLDTASLGREGAFDFRLLQANVRSEIFDLDRMKSFKRNPMNYAEALSVTSYVTRNFASEENRLRSIIAIEKQAGALFAAARENLNPVLPKIFVETAIEINDGNRAFLEKDMPLAFAGVKDPALMEELKTANATALQEIESYSAWLKSERLPRADANFALGPERFREMLRLGEAVEMTPEAILELGLRELKKEQQKFAEAARAIDANKPAHEVFKAIQSEHPSARNLIPETRKNLEAIRQFVAGHHIATIPSEVRVRVEETPPPLRRTSFASMDSPGPFETQATEAFYYVTPVEPEWPDKQKEEWLTAFNFYTTDIVSIHEAYPGHYVHFLAVKNSNASRLSKIFGSYAFTEGWAHYCEQMLLDEGFPNAGSPEEKLRAAKYRLAQSDEALLRICRLCVSIQLHTKGMSVEEATRFFIQNCYYEEKTAHQEAVRGTFDPGYLNYTLGKLMILKLRADWQAQEGDRYSLQAFHDELLRHGAPALPVLRERMLKDKKLWPDIL